MKIRPLQFSDKAMLMTWTNDVRLWPYILKNRFVNEIEHEAFFEALANDKSRDYFILEDETAPLGLCGFTHLDFFHSKGELFLYIVEETARGKGHGNAMMDFLLDYGFNHLGLNRIYLRVGKANQQAFKLYNHHGMQLEGILRDELKIGGHFVDVILMSILKDDYDSRSEHGQD